MQSEQRNHGWRCEQWLSLPGSQSAGPRGNAGPCIKWPWWECDVVDLKYFVFDLVFFGLGLVLVWFGLVWFGFFFFFFFFGTISLPPSASYRPSFHFLLPLLRDTYFSHLLLVPNTFLAVPGRDKGFMSHCSRMSRICIQKGPTLPAASRASLGRSISRSPFFLGLRLPRCEMHAVLYSAIDFLMPAPVHRAPALIVLIDFLEVAPGWCGLVAVGWMPPKAQHVVRRVRLWMHCWSEWVHEDQISQKLFV